MKRVLMVLCVLALLAGGCNGVQLNKEYSALLDAAASQASVDAAAVAAERMTPEAVSASLDARATDWSNFRDAYKRTWWIIGPVYLSSSYATLVDQTLAWTQDAAARSRSPSYAFSSRVEALRIEAGLWQKFVKARDGKKD